MQKLLQTSLHFILEKTMLKSNPLNFKSMLQAIEHAKQSQVTFSITHFLHFIPLEMFFRFSCLMLISLHHEKFLSFS